MSKVVVVELSNYRRRRWMLSWMTFRSALRTIGKVGFCDGSFVTLAGQVDRLRGVFSLDLEIGSKDRP